MAPREFTGHEVHVRGLEELDRRLKMLAAEVRVQTKKNAIKRAVKIVKALAEQKAPRASGAHKFLSDRPLADSFTTSIKNTRQPEGVVRNIAPHSHLMELGWWWTTHRGRVVKFIGSGAGTNNSIGPRPFLRPALDESFFAVRAAFADSVDRAIRKHGTA